MVASLPSAIVATSKNSDIITVQDVTKRYGKTTKALNQMNLEIKKGELLGLIGPDGAGKTTALKILAGVLEPNQGEVSVFGRKPRDSRQFIGYVPQNCALYPELTVDEQLRYEAGIRGVSEKVSAKSRETHLKNMGLLEFSDRLVFQLSGGMRQKLALCCALIAEPQLILLDEPTTGLDPISRRELWQELAILSDTGVTAIVATPFLDEAERCHRVALMYEGSIHETGTPASLQSALGLQRLEMVFEGSKQLNNRLDSIKDDCSKGNIVDIRPLGDCLEILAKNAKTAETEIREILATDNIAPLSIQVKAPTMENVFIIHLRELGIQERHSIPLPRQKQLQKQEIDAALSVQDLSKSFGNFKAVANVNFEMHHGEIFGLLGANGAGKTTTIKMLCGLLPPTSGQITLAGQKASLKDREFCKKVGYMSQKFTLYDSLTVAENLEFYASIYELPTKRKKQMIDWVFSVCDLKEVRNTLVKSLPLGWKQGIALGAAMMHEPEILFLDEPTAGVDPLARRQFWSLIRDFARNGAAVLVTTHYMDEAEYCNRLALMTSGAIVAQGSPNELKTSRSEELFEIKTTNLTAALQCLNSRMELWRIAVFGNSLHVLLDKPSVDIENVKSFLHEAGNEVTSFNPIPFSLEDAFISVIRRKGEGHP